LNPGRVVMSHKKEDKCLLVPESLILGIPWAQTLFQVDLESWVAACPSHNRPCMRREMATISVWIAVIQHFSGIHKTNNAVVARSSLTHFQEFQKVRVVASGPWDQRQIPVGSRSRLAFTGSRSSSAHLLCDVGEVIYSLSWLHHLQKRCSKPCSTCFWENKWVKICNGVR
jgi:hypothetical protein